jgi:NhaP-type Na+/H+ or K+/H+ antiporter
VVFTLNVLAFLLMGMQARSIVLRMQGPHLRHSLEFAGLVIVAIVITRMIVVLGYSYWDYRREKSPDARNEAIFMGWCGMRGFVTLATAFALPENFPHRDTAVLTAFAVALSTLVLQGLTLAPLVRKLGLDRSQESVAELASARVALAQSGLESVANEEGPEAENLQYRLSLKLRRCLDRGQCGPLDRMHSLGLKAIEAERAELEKLRSDDKVSATGYLDLQEQLDWAELTLLSDSDRRIEEI